MKSPILALLLVTLICPFCSKDNDAHDDLSQQDTQFMTKATYINLGETGAGNLAVTKATNSAVKNFGQMMISDHNSAQQDLSEIASDVNYSLPNDTDAEHKAKAEKLAALSGDAFDSTYMYMMVEGHTKAIALHEETIQRGSNDAVKRYATEKLPVIKHHKMMADSLARALYPSS